MLQNTLSSRFNQMHRKPSTTFTFKKHCDIDLYTWSWILPYTKAMWVKSFQIDVSRDEQFCGFASGFSEVIDEHSTPTVGELWPV